MPHVGAMRPLLVQPFTAHKHACLALKVSVGVLSLDSRDVLAWHAESTGYRSRLAVLTKGERTLQKACCMCVK